MTQRLQGAQRIAIVGTLADTMLGFRGELIKDMVAAGHEVYAFATDYNAETEHAVRELGAHPVRFRMGRLSTNPVADLISTWQLYRLFKKHRITMTFCYFSKPAIYGTLAAWLSGVPMRVAKIEGMGRVFTIGPAGDNRRKQLIRHVMTLLFRLSLPRAHHLFVLNEGDQKELVDMGITQPYPCLIGGIGVCLEHYYFCPPVTQPVRFIFVGRLLPEKGIRYFVEAAKNLRPRYPQAEFVIVGATDPKSGIDKHMLEALENQGILIYRGSVKDVTPWLAQASVFVLPTYYREGVPRSTQEALAMGRPVITTDLPGCRETVIDGVNGYLIPPHDQHALENAMLKLIKHPELLESMGVASYKLACEKFDVRQINARILGLLGLEPANVPAIDSLEEAAREVPEQQIGAI